MAHEIILPISNPQVEEYELCLWWDMVDGQRNSSLYSLGDLAFALEHGTLTGCTSIHIEVVPIEQAPFPMGEGSD